MKYDLAQMLEDIRQDEALTVPASDRNILSQEQIRQLAASRKRRVRAAPVTPETVPEQGKDERDS